MIFVRVYNQLMFISEAFANALVLPSTRSLADKMLIQSDSSPKFDFLVLDHKLSPDLLRANLLPRLWKYDKDWVKGLVALVCTKPLTEYKSIFSAQFLGNVCMVFVWVYNQLMFISKAFADALVLPSTRSLADKMLIQSNSSPKFDFLVLDRKISPDLLRANLLPRLWKYDKDWVKGLVALVCT